MSDFEISGNGKEIATALSHLSATIPSRSTLAVLSCAALRINNGELAASTSNLDAMHTLKLPVAVRAGNDGAGCCAGLSMLSGLLAKFGDAEVMIRAEKGTLKVTSGSKTATLQTLPLDQFPEMATTAEEKGKVDGAKLAAAIRSVAFAQCKDTSRYMICGIYFNGSGRIVATTGHILATVDGAAELTPFLGVIPTPAVSPILGVLDRNPELTVFDGESEVRFEASGESYLTKKIEGNYPNWEAVMPRYSKPSRFSFDRDAMKSALQFASMYTDDGREAVTLSHKDGALSISITNPDSGNFSDLIPLTDAPAVKMIASVKAEILAKMIAHCTTDTVYFECEPYDDGAVMGPLSFEDRGNNWKAVAMPCRPA